MSERYIRFGHQEILGVFAFKLRFMFIFHWSLLL